jgi:hypothetical protein
MSTLFGAQPAATSSTTGDTSKDVEINSQILPEDSVSDIACGLVMGPEGAHLQDYGQQCGAGVDV